MGRNSSFQGSGIDYVNDVWGKRDPVTGKYPGQGLMEILARDARYAPFYASQGVYPSQGRDQRGSGLGAPGSQYGSVRENVPRGTGAPPPGWTPPPTSRHFMSPGGSQTGSGDGVPALKRAWANFNFQNPAAPPGGGSVAPVNRPPAENRALIQAMKNAWGN